MIKTIEPLEKAQFQKAWSVIEDCLMIRHDQDYDHAVKILDQLLDAVGDNEKHPLYGYLDALGTMIESYEKEHYPIQETSAAKTLAFLMEEHGLKQSDMPEVGSQGVISEILHGKRQLTLRQIKALSKRFNVSPETLID